MWKWSSSSVIIYGVRNAAIFLISAFIFGYAGFVFASATNGTIDTVYKYAWAENYGWINFGCDNCGVAVTDAGLTGYAWAEHYGWINLDPTGAAGVTNNGEGTLGGYAWGSTIGWINFTGVTINSSGEFLGYATVDIDSSQINFNCTNGSSCASADFKVKTDWRPASSRTTAASGGIVGSGNRPRQAPYAPIAVVPPTSPIATIPGTELSANILDAVSSLISSLFKPKVEVPALSPLVLRDRWNLLPEQAIRTFVFAPLPYEIRILAAKFPELDRTFKEVGVERFSDMGRLAGVDLNLPGLTDVLNTSIKNLAPEEIAEFEKIEGVKISLPGFSGESGTLPSSVGTGNIALIQGLPVAKFSLEAKRNLPGEFVFARGAGELLDLNVALSVEEESGEVSQRISALPGKNLKLVVKPLSAAKSVTGYIVFLAATPKVSANEILRSSLAASALFSTLSEKVTDPEPIEKKLVLASFEYEDPDRDGIYTADITTPAVPGEYEIITIIEYVDPELGSRKMSMVTVIDPEGYIYEENGGKETRIPGAVISLYKLDPATKEYKLWNAKDYQQENPQVTDIRGTYSFLVPEGSYYFHIEAPGYKVYEGKVFLVRNGDSVHENIELKPLGGWFKEPDWQTLLLIVVLLLLVYNLYRNTLRDKLSKLLNKNAGQ